MVNYYEILNIPFNATLDEIKNSFRKMIKEYHPDTAKTYDKEKLANILKAYKTLSDNIFREEYNKKILNNKKMVKIQKEKYYKLPLSRVRYNFLLSDLLQKRLLKKQIKRKDRFYHYGKSEKNVTDVTIFITKFEATIGVVAQIAVPAKVLCDVCYGEDRYCAICNGLGKIHTTEKVSIIIPAGVRDETVVNIDLNEIKNRPTFLYFKLPFLSAKIKILK